MDQLNKLDFNAETKSIDDNRMNRRGRGLEAFNPALDEDEQLLNKSDEEDQEAVEDLEGNILFPKVKAFNYRHTPNAFEEILAYDSKPLFKQNKKTTPYDPRSPD